ncbi:VOC family protein [Streptomyces sp. NPDC096311]|uniref:VOC family protein n=1 Tax=Streptomyces sp. NPDC096311 TaxID=3366083 RepID=UPI003814FC3A
MSLHRLTGLTIGVPNVDRTARYYDDFGLRPVDESGTDIELPSVIPTDGIRFATHDGGQQLTLVHSPRRRLVGLGVAADDEDDLARISESLRRRDHEHELSGDTLRTSEPGANICVEVSVAGRIDQTPTPWPVTNGPGREDRVDHRAPALAREGRVRPRKLGHVVIGSTNRELTRDFFLEGLGFKVSDEVPGLASFMRCSSDHHNVLVQSAPIDFLHHTAWQVDDVDEVGRGATEMLTKDPSRHAWGLGRHHIGSNFFWYLRDPAGNFSEYYSDMDCIVDDAVWRPEVFTGPKGLYNWGPPPPSDFIEPSDVAEMLASVHTG